MRRRITSIFPKHYSVNPELGKSLDKQTLKNVKLYLVKLFIFVVSQSLFTVCVTVLLNIKDDIKEALFNFALSLYSLAISVPIILLSSGIILSRKMRNCCPLNIIMHLSLVVLSSIRTASLTTRHDLIVTLFAFLLVFITLILLYITSKIIQCPILFHAILFLIVYSVLVVYAMVYSIIGLFFHAPILFIILLLFLAIACSISTIFIFQFMHEVYYLVSEEVETWPDTPLGSIVFTATVIYIMSLQIFYSYFFILGMIMEF
ncbi:uncharacterized protein LOC106663656 [Cimex lectularius]|uniref:Uncharacterized protein n=1 Tax=Cimex lectularius TaxID=79782 RepID=A0A8I6RFG5_CIMLE|nr:uncharacterized protein LOC106663656 [Cimex lectularius]